MEIPGLHGWHWEEAVTFAGILTDIVLHGSTSVIQKTALVGKNKDVTIIHHTVPQCPMFSAGLLDMVHFCAVSETGDKGKWKTRSTMDSLDCSCFAFRQNKRTMNCSYWQMFGFRQKKEERKKKGSI